jgi:hypothetical protein
MSQMPGLSRVGACRQTPCPTCGGTEPPRTRSFQVKVLAGRRAQRIRLAGRGEPGPAGGQPGDLFVRVRVQRHAFFGRAGHDLTLELPVTYPEAALGAEVRVPTLNGPITMKVPAGTPNGKTFRLKGKGAPKRGGHGDLLVTTRIESRAAVQTRKSCKQLRETEGIATSNSGWTRRRPWRTPTGGRAPRAGRLHHRVAGRGVHHRPSGCTSVAGLAPKRRRATRRGSDRYRTHPDDPGAIGATASASRGKLSIDASSSRRCAAH